MKASLFIMTGLAALSLSACGATTGSVAKTMAKQAAMSSVAKRVTPTAAPAQTQAVTTTAMRAAAVDGSTECAALATQIAEVDAVIAESTKTIGGSGRANLGGQLAATGASQAAMRTGALGAMAKVPFGGLFAKSALDSVANSGQKKIEKAQRELQEANLRKASLSGVYAGKNCAP